MESTTALWMIAILLSAAGLAGLIVPALPGIPLLVAGLFVGAWAEGFVYIGPGTLVVIVLLGAVAYGVDVVAGALGAKKFGASRRAMVGAAVGGFAGIWLGLPGIILGPFVGAVAAELSQKRPLKEAGRAGFGTMLGLAIGTAAKFALAFTMIGLFLLDRFFLGAT
jgi:uncharacterized protein YqgC (DUF456 family)